MCGFFSAAPPQEAPPPALCCAGTAPPCVAGGLVVLVAETLLAGALNLQLVRLSDRWFCLGHGRPCPGSWLNNPGFLGEYGIPHESRTGGNK